MNKTTETNPVDYKNRLIFPS